MSFSRLWSIFWEYRDVLLSGIWITVALSVLAMLLAVAAGLVACVGTLARSRLVRAPAVFYVEFCRNTPILVQLVWVHYAWPEIFGVKFDAFTSSLIALALQSSGYLAEEFRAGIESIEKGQIEAAQSLGMTYARLMRQDRPAAGLHPDPARDPQPVRHLLQIHQHRLDHRGSRSHVSGRADRQRDFPADAGLHRGGSHLLRPRVRRVFNRSIPFAETSCRRLLPDAAPCNRSLIRSSASRRSRSALERSMCSAASISWSRRVRRWRSSGRAVLARAR